MIQTFAHRAGWLLSAMLAATPAFAQGSVHTLWEATDEGREASSVADAVTLANGDVVCVGSRSVATGTELIAVRFDADGNLVWLRRVANPYGAGGVSAAKAVATAAGEIAVLGTVDGGATTDDFFLVLFGDDGSILAQRTIDEFDWDLPVDFEVGPSGNLVMCGYGIDPGQYVVFKLDHDLGTIWRVYLGNPAQDYQNPTDLTITPNGDVLVAGEVYDGVQQDVRLDRLSPNGALLYSKDFGDPTYGDYSGVVCAGSNGGTYFAFRKAAFEPSAEARTYRISQSGTVQWGMIDTDLAWVHIIEIDNDEFIAAAVGPFSLGTMQTFRRFTAAGLTLGTRTLELAGYQHNWIERVRIGADDIIYTTAHATPDGGDATDWFVNALSIDGVLVYQWAYNSGAGTYDFPKALATLGHGRIVVAGEIGDAFDDDAHFVCLQALLEVSPTLVTTLR